MKQCLSCKLLKNENDYHKDSTKKDGLYPICKDCRRKRMGYGQKWRKQTDWKLGSGSYIQWKGIRLHRFLVEKQLGRKLKRTEHVHHLNGDKLDNRLDNLVVLSERDHHSIHAKEISAKRKNGKEVSCHTCFKKHYFSRAIIIKMGKIYQCKKCYCGSGGAYGRSRINLWSTCFHYQNVGRN